MKEVYLVFSVKQTRKRFHPMYVCNVIVLYQIDSRFTKCLYYFTVLTQCFPMARTFCFRNVTL